PAARRPSRRFRATRGPAPPSARPARRRRSALAFRCALPSSCYAVLRYASWNATSALGIASRTERRATIRSSPEELARQATTGGTSDEPCGDELCSDERCEIQLADHGSRLPIYHSPFTIFG